MNRVYVDFMKHGGSFVFLTALRTLRDLHLQRIELHEGLRFCLYQDDSDGAGRAGYIHAEGEVFRCDDNGKSCWAARLIGAIEFTPMAEVASSTAINDWRLQGQERFLKGVSLVRREYLKGTEVSDHDHCEFCWRRFSGRPEDLHVGYTTTDNYHWICEDCFRDFAAMFQWKI